MPWGAIQGGTGVSRRQEEKGNCWRGSLSVGNTSKAGEAVSGSGGQCYFSGSGTLGLSLVVWYVALGDLCR